MISSNDKKPSLVFIVSVLISFGVIMGVVLSFFPEATQDNKVILLLERFYYAITSFIFLVIIYKMTHNQSILVRHQIDLGNVVRKAVTEAETLIKERKR